MDIDFNNTTATLYRKKLGETLRKIRIKKGYSIPDIIYMTGLSKSTVTKVESGDAKTIDSYINYSVSVEYPFATFNDFNIKLGPITKLSSKMLEATKLTAKIKQYIIEGNFLKNGKTVADIRDELARLKMINATQVSSSNIAGVMRNLVSDNIVKVGEKDGRKNVYMRAE
ncbi:MAG: helix-turn-helix transcriptional regulator [Flavobacteriia bacterium]|nr:helix-turn-helix transcriptional regulator [Flavobacteriia bacterium]